MTPEAILKDDVTNPESVLRPVTSVSGIRVGIDASNLALEKGTGVATYARTLSYALRDMGALIDIVYGYPAKSTRNKLLREINFFDVSSIDPHNRERMPKPAESEFAEGDMKLVQAKQPSWVSHIPQYAASFLGQKAIEIPITGDVIARTFQSRLPKFDRITNSSNLFDVAQWHFKYYRRFLTLRVLNPPEIMHWTFPLPIRLAGSKNIYTLHDLVPLRLPHTTLDDKKYYHRLIKKCVSSADHICTVSEQSKSDIQNLFQIADDRISNTYQSVVIPPNYLEKSNEEVAREINGIFGLEYKRYMLFFGSIEPKKNIGRLIEGFLSSRCKDPLVIVGAQAWKSRQELRLYKEYINRFEKLGGAGGERRIIMFGYAPFSLLTSLIRGAKAVLFPSLYEGFGLPVLEAMMLGTPVLSSRESSIPEIAGDAALLVDPYNIEEMANGIERLDRDQLFREQLSQKGLVQAQQFNMEKYRLRLDAMYQKVLAG